MNKSLFSLNRLRSPLLALPFLAFGTASVQAVIVDLTTAGASSSINGAIYQQIVPRATGTGGIDSFAQIGDASPGTGTLVQGYNTNDNGTLDNGSSPNFNHSITLSQVPVVTIGGTAYRQFMLDINENNNAALDQFLSLDEVQIFVGGPANSGIDTFTGGILDGHGAPVYRMDAGVDSWVALNYALNTGSGSGDMFLNVPNTLFAGFAGTDVVTLYSHFGAAGSVDPLGSAPFGNYNNSDGFEEWALVEPGTPTVPEGGASVALLGLGLFGMAAAGRVLRKK